MYGYLKNLLSNTIIKLPNTEYDEIYNELNMNKLNISTESDKLNSQDENEDEIEIITVHAQMIENIKVINECDEFDKMFIKNTYEENKIDEYLIPILNSTFVYEIHSLINKNEYIILNNIEILDKIILKINCDNICFDRIEILLNNKVLFELKVSKLNVVYISKDFYIMRFDLNKNIIYNGNYLLGIPLLLFDKSELKIKLCSDDNDIAPIVEFYIGGFVILPEESKLFLNNNKKTEIINRLQFISNYDIEKKTYIMPYREYIFDYTSISDKQYNYKFMLQKYQNLIKITFSKKSEQKYNIENYVSFIIIKLNGLEIFNDIPYLLYVNGSFIYELYETVSENTNIDIHIITLEPINKFDIIVCIS